MLLARLLTAIVLVPLVVAGVLLASSEALAAVLGLFVLLGARELGRLGGLAGDAAQWAYAIALALLLLILFLWSDSSLNQWLEVAAALFWLPATVVLVMRRRPLMRAGGVRPAVLVLGGAQLVIAWLALIDLHRAMESGPLWVLLLLLTIWTADSGAYFAGRAFGRHRLSPQVSPGKTWEGAAGGLAAVVVLAGIFHLAVGPGLPLWSLAALCVFTAVVSIGGDLWESLLKRQAGLKDSGTLLPGHGGVLDRIDSLIAAAPVFALGLRLAGGMP